MSITVACVLKTGEFVHPGHADKRVEYEPAHVQWLQRQVEEKLTLPHRFVCLSDVEIKGVETIPLRHKWPGWWSKMELFANFDRALYLDLDTVLVGNIDEIAANEDRGIAVLRNLSSPTLPRIGSGVMQWCGDYLHLYKAFLCDPQGYMAEYVRSGKWGDQGFIQDHLSKWDYLQDRHPGAIVSYKFGMKAHGDPPPGCRIVCFHGKPKPHEVEGKHSWITPLRQSA